MGKNKLIGNVKDTAKLGVTSMGGMYAMGALGGVPGMPSEAAGVAKIAGASIGLANVGQLAKTSMGLVNMVSEQTTKKKTKKKMFEF
jgi:hypothetical protein